MNRLPLLLSRLKTYNFESPLQLWNSTHLSRRAGVLIVLTPLGPNDLEVLSTVRTQQLSYAGDVALPGGKADTLDESPLDVALREANEEVNLSSSDVEFITYMPGYLSSKQSMVVPSIVWSPTPVQAKIMSEAEVHKIFRFPLSRFLKTDGHSFIERQVTRNTSVKLNYFEVLAHDKKVGEPKFERIWGLTAGILVDCARVAFQKVPDFLEGDDYRPESGHMSALRKLEKRGTLKKEKIRKQDQRS